VDGTITVAQPLIAPMYGGLASSELLSLLLGEETPARISSRARTRARITGWRENVERGFVPNPQPAFAQLQLQALPTFQLTHSQQSGSKRKQGELEVVFHFSSFTYDAGSRTTRGCGRRPTS